MIFAEYLVDGPASTEKTIFTGSLFTVEAGDSHEAAFHPGPVLDSTPRGCYTVAVEFLYRGTVIADAAFGFEVVPGRCSNSG